MGGCNPAFLQSSTYRSWFSAEGVQDHAKCCHELWCFDLCQAGVCCVRTVRVQVCRGHLALHSTGDVTQGEEKYLLGTLRTQRQEQALGTEARSPMQEDTANFCAWSVFSLVLERRLVAILLKKRRKTQPGSVCVALSASSTVSFPFRCPSSSTGSLAWLGSVPCWAVAMLGCRAAQGHPDTRGKREHHSTLPTLRFSSSPSPKSGF